MIFTGVSKACCKWLEHFNIKAKGVLYNAIETSEYELYKNDINQNENIKILYAGRLIKDKGVLILGEAYEELAKKYKNITLALVGDGALYEELKKKENIEVLGRLERDDIMRQYANADIFVSPSSFPEGLPTTVLEAGLMKCAVVATDAGGTAEIIEDGKEGLLCKPEVQDIVEKLEILIKDKELRKNLLENLHNKICKQFSWDNTTKQLLEIIENKERK